MNAHTLFVIIFAILFVTISAGVIDCIIVACILTAVVVKYIRPKLLNIWNRYV